MKFAKDDWVEYLHLLVFGRRDYDLSHGDPAGWMRDSELVAVGEMDVWSYMRVFTDTFNSLCIARHNPEAVYMDPRIIATTVWFAAHLRRSANDNLP